MNFIRVDDKSLINLDNVSVIKLDDSRIVFHLNDDKTYSCRFFDDKNAESVFEEISSFLDPSEMRPVA